jgi:hypothetical protein
MPDNIDPFPQHHASKRRGKPTIADIVNDGIKTGQTPEAIFATIGTLYPKATMGEIKAAFTAEIERQAADIGQQERELDSMVALQAIIKPIGKEPGNKGLTILQLTRIAADRGDQQAKAYLAHFESDEAKAWERDFEAAVALDPYWEMSADGRSATRLPGARHKTAEDLVAAYRANQLGNDATD